MLYALATPGSAFKPSLKKIPNTWRLEKFKKIYNQKRGLGDPSSDGSVNSIEFINFD